MKRRKYQTTETDPEMTYMTELIDKDVKIVIMIFHISKKMVKTSMFRHVIDITKDSAELLKMKNEMFEMIITLDDSNSRLDTAGGYISELDDTALKMIQNKHKKEKEKKIIVIRATVSNGTISSTLIYV